MITKQLENIVAGLQLAKDSETWEVVGPLASVAAVLARLATRKAFCPGRHALDLALAQAYRTLGDLAEHGGADGERGLAELRARLTERAEQQANPWRTFRLALASGEITADQVQRAGKAELARREREAAMEERAARRAERACVPRMAA